MHLSTSFRLSTATLATSILLFTLQVLAVSSSDHGALTKRAEEAGSGCSTEGQWHCMTNSFQRCAGGQWSVEMRMAEGTKCTPAGYTDDYNFQIEHDGTVNGQGSDDQNSQGNGGGNGGSSVGPKGSVSKITVMAVLGLWVIFGFIL
ncbi:hypothetical protein FALBO_14918 [Fusarium albosuccineum]|uniref:Extracellular protein n=1 Tax=Fusarium albosuccineum TaxID=1237068 RepID=A0A8H4KYF8_9HYPO|nr:hypothetical protein FALBO_14918 [Fusarium albosuccineum]